MLQTLMLSMWFSSTSQYDGVHYQKGKENMMGLYVGMSKMIPPCSTSPALHCPTL